MDFSTIALDDATVAFQDDLRNRLDEHVTQQMIEAEWSHGDGHDATFHRALGAKGWAFPALPVDEGGGRAQPPSMPDPRT